MKINVLSILAFLYVILPEYFALEVSSSLPLLTGSRILILLLLAYALKKNAGKLQYSGGSYSVFFLIMILLCVIHIKDSGSSSIKQIFCLCFEQLLLIMLVNSAVSDTEQIKKMLKIMVYASAFISILSVFEAFTGNNLFYYLTLVKREMLQASYDRIGIRRAEGPFGHPVYMAVYNMCIVPFCLYFYEETSDKKFIYILLLNIVSLLLSVTRGIILVLAVFMVIYYFKSNSRFKRRYGKYINRFLLVAAVAGIIVPQFRDLLLNMWSSTITSLGFGSTLIEDRNVLGLQSRLTEFSGLLWLRNHGSLLIGFGPDAQMRGLVYYLNSISGLWNQVRSFDIGYVAYILEYGIIGFLAYIYLYFSLFRLFRHKDRLSRAFRYFYIVYLLCLLSTVGIDKVFWLVTALGIRYRKILNWNREAL